MIVSVAAIVSVVAALAGSVTGEGCELNLQTQTVSSKEPLILEVTETRGGRPSPHLIRPKVKQIDRKTSQGVIPVPEGKELLIACIGKDNYIDVNKKETANVKCSKGELTVEGKEADRTTLSCHKDVSKSWLEKTNEVCGEGDNKGTKFELGFKLDDDKQDTFFALVDLCHNIKNMVTYYSHHELYGASLKGAVQSSLRRPFSQGPKELKLFPGINADKAYTKVGQKAALSAILGEAAASIYTNDRTSLARGHLSPDADFIFNTGQQMTYYFVNVAPQWNTFNSGHWLAVENTVRALAVKVDDTLQVWTGTYGILKLMGSDGEEKEIYLDPKEAREHKPPRKSRKPKNRGSSEESDDEDDKSKKRRKPKAPKKPKEHEQTEPETIDEGSYLPVPEVYWKLVQHGTACTVAVGVNNVHLKEIPSKTICSMKDVDGWPNLKNDLGKGYVYYCDYDSFKRTVHYAPDIECTQILKFPE